MKIAHHTWGRACRWKEGKSDPWPFPHLWSQCCTSNLRKNTCMCIITCYIHGEGCIKILTRSDDSPVGGRSKVYQSLNRSGCSSRIFSKSSRHKISSSVWLANKSERLTGSLESLNTCFTIWSMGVIPATIKNEFKKLTKI